MPDQKERSRSASSSAPRWPAAAGRRRRRWPRQQVSGGRERAAAAGERRRRRPSDTRCAKAGNSSSGRRPAVQEPLPSSSSSGSWQYHHRWHAGCAPLLGGVCCGFSLSRLKSAADMPCSSRAGWPPHGRACCERSRPKLRCSCAASPGCCLCAPCSSCPVCGCAERQQQPAKQTCSGMGSSRSSSSSMESSSGSTQHQQGAAAQQLQGSPQKHSSSKPGSQPTSTVHHMRMLKGPNKRAPAAPPGCTRTRRSCQTRAA